MKKKKKREGRLPRKCTAALSCCCSLQSTCKLSRNGREKKTFR